VALSVLVGEVHRPPVIVIEPAVKTCDSLLVFSSKQLDLGLEQEVIDVEGDIGDGEDKNLDSKQEDLARNKLCRLQCGG
jgi:hypothetical protein